ncbi:hypothetical protein ACMVYQ_10450 [Staphylococcus capitis]|uniref:hypothetical protein n=2 Tax=Staphylococcus TaxID=1279 RepID=UPI0039EC5AAC
MKEVKGEMNTITKKYDFFVLTYEFKGKVDKNYERMNEYLKESLEEFKKNKDFNFIKCNKSTYIGFNYIEKYEYINNEVWVFCLSKTVTTKIAVINEIKKTVKDGRSEYGDEPEQGLTVDTVVLFCPRNGVVIIPSNRGGISQSDFKSFFYKTVKKKGAKLNVAINNTKIDNLKHIDDLKEIEFNISRIVDIDKIKNKNQSTQRDKKMIDKLNADSMKVKYTSKSLDISESLKQIKNILAKDETKEVKKMVIRGENDGHEQIIDLIANRLIYIDDDVELNNNNKITINSMIKSIKKAYRDNLKIIEKDIL